jgi:hypothetical protein
MAPHDSAPPAPEPAAKAEPLLPVTSTAAAKEPAATPKISGTDPKTDQPYTPSKERKPLPLLARRKTKLKPPRELVTGEGTDLSRPRRRTPLWLKILNRVLVYAALIGMGFGAYYQFRETQVHGILTAPGYELPKEIYLVRDFTDDLRTLRGEFGLAREPYFEELKIKENALRQVSSDFAGLEERQRLIRQEIDTAKAEIGEVARQTTLKADQLWTEQAPLLDQDYEKTLNEFEQRLLGKVKALGLDYKNISPVRSPEVWVNAFRLALYDPPKTVKTGEERIWAEAQLKEWRDFEASHQLRRQTIKTEADAIKKLAGPRLEEVNLRVRRLQERLKEADLELAPIRVELEQVNGQLESSRVLLEQQTKKYFDQLYQIPTRNVIDKFAMEQGRRWQWRRLEQLPQYPPGSYLLWLTLKKDGEDYWALVPFHTEAYKRTTIQVSDRAFVKARTILE